MGGLQLADTPLGAGGHVRTRARSNCCNDACTPNVSAAPQYLAARPCAQTTERGRSDRGAAERLKRCFNLGVADCPVFANIFKYCQVLVHPGLELI